jgi:hypothetical protein
VDDLDPNENPEGYILHLEDLLRDRQRIIKDLEWKLKEVNRCAEVQEECAQTVLNYAERVEAALHTALTGCNHLGLLIGANHPPDTASHDDALEHYGAGDQYEIWCCWRAIRQAANTLQPST